MLSRENYKGLEFVKCIDYDLLKVFYIALGLVVSFVTLISDGYNEGETYVMT